MDPELLASVRRLAVPEDDILAAARSRAVQVTPTPPAELGALLRILASVTGTRHAVEIGAAGGVTGTYLVAGMPAGMLTCIEGDAHLHGLATAAYDELGIAERVRAILGDPATVADRLSDAQYELVLLQQDPESTLGLLPTAARLLRDGGLLVARRVCADREVAPVDVLEAVRGDDWVDATVLDVEDGLLLAQRAARTD